MIIDIIISVLAVFCVVMSVYFAFFRKKKHSGCCGKCSGCSMNYPMHKDITNNQKEEDADKTDTDK